MTDVSFLICYIVENREWIINFTKQFLCILGKSLLFFSLYLLSPVAFIFVLTLVVQGQTELD